MGAREGIGEALEGARAGRAIEPRNQGVRDADTVKTRGRQHRWRRAKPTSCARSGSISALVAVGTALAGGPPHRSQRAELPHWAPASGQTRTRTPRRDAPSWFLRATSRTRSSSRDTPIPALCPGRVSPSVFPLAGPLSSPASAAAALFGGFAGTTGPSDFPRSFISGVPPLAFPERPAR